MNGKGSKRRPRYIEDAENVLRWELIYAKPEEKPAILEQIETIRKKNLNKESRI